MAPITRRLAKAQSVLITVKFIQRAKRFAKQINTARENLINTGKLYAPASQSKEPRRGDPIIKDLPKKYLWKNEQHKNLLQLLIFTHVNLKVKPRRVKAPQGRCIEWTNNKKATEW